MFCANCISEKGPFRREVQDDRSYIFCVDCLERSVRHYDAGSLGVSAGLGHDGVGVGNTRSSVSSIGSRV